MVLLQREIFLKINKQKKIHFEVQVFTDKMHGKDVNIFNVVKYL